MESKTQSADITSHSSRGPSEALLTGNNEPLARDLNPAAAAEKPTLRTDPQAYIATLPAGFRGLYSLVWFCRTAQLCSTALRIRAFLCSLYNGAEARKVDLSDVQGFDDERRRDFVEVLLHLGNGSGLYDHHIRDAFRNCGIERYFDAGFPKRRTKGGAL